MSEWQPIETAPDDQNLLIYLPEFASSGGTFIGRREFGWWHIIGTSVQSCGLEKVSHWMPLPDPPTATAKGATA